MKITKPLIILLLALLSFSSCKEAEKKETAKIEYQCPMKCEGEKIYHKEGSCPVCEMKLRKKKTEEKTHDDEHH